MNLRSFNRHSRHNAEPEPFLIFGAHAAGIFQNVVTNDSTGMSSACGCAETKPADHPAIGETQSVGTPNLFCGWSNRGQEFVCFDFLSDVTDQFEHLAFAERNQ